MKKRSWRWVLALNLVVLALGAHADIPPYTLTQFENPDFKDYPSSQMMSWLNLTREDLAPYLCDGKREYEFLPEFLHPNPVGDSLRVKSDKGPEIYVYRNGDLLLNGAPAGDRKSSRFLKGVVETLATLDSLPTGKILIERLQHSPFPLTITLGDPHFAPANDTGKPFSGMEMAQAIQYLITLRFANYGNQFNRIGTGGPIQFNPAFKADFIESDGETRTVKPQVVLAHEMFHAFDSVRGFLDRRMIVGDAYEFQEISEYRATYMENRIREESGLQYRKYYGTYTKAEIREGKVVHGTLLGADGKPMLLPTPCLKTAE